MKRLTFSMAFAGILASVSALNASFHERDQAGPAGPMIRAAPAGPMHSAQEIKKQATLDAIEKILFLREQCIFLSDHLKERKDLFGENVAFLEGEKFRQISALGVAEAAEEAARQACRTSERGTDTARLKELAEAYRQAAARVICLKQLINILDERLASIQETLRGLNAEQEEHLALQQARERDILAVDAETQIVTTSGLEGEEANFDLAYQAIQLKNKINFLDERRNPPRLDHEFRKWDNTFRRYIAVLQETGKLLSQEQQEENRKRLGIPTHWQMSWVRILLNFSSREIHVVKKIMEKRFPAVPREISGKIAALTIMGAKNKGPAAEMRFPMSLEDGQQTYTYEPLVKISQHLAQRFGYGKDLQEAWHVASAYEERDGLFSPLSSEFPLRLGVKQDSQLSLEFRWNLAISDFHDGGFITANEAKLLHDFAKSHSSQMLHAVEILRKCNGRAGKIGEMLKDVD